MSHRPTFFVLGRVEKLTLGGGPTAYFDAMPWTYRPDF